MRDQEMQETIERYIAEGLPDQEEDQLWVRFLEDPEWFSYFETYSALVYMKRHPDKTKQL